jgi:CheY-like chemotaxis protein
VRGGVPSVSPVYTLDADFLRTPAARPGRPRNPHRHHPVAGKTVLLVDSHEDSRAIYSLILRHHGFAVLAAALWEEGRRLAHAQLPDVIVLELPPRYPLAWNAPRDLLAHPDTAGIPLLGLGTGYAAGDHDRALAAGFARYLMKPLSPLDLVDEVRRIVESES